MMSLYATFYDDVTICDMSLCRRYMRHVIMTSLCQKFFDYCLSADVTNSSTATSLVLYYAVTNPSRLLS